MLTRWGEWEENSGRGTEWHPKSNDDDSEEGTSTSVCGEVEVRNVTQLLDHFDPNNTATWENRYWVEESFYQPGGPIFIYVGDVFDFMAEIWLNISHFRDLAEENNAYLVATEYRFYGESHPTPDVSLESLQYLTTDQAMGDIMGLLDFLRESNEDLADAKVIAAGVGQGAALAVWLRQERPDVIDGVWSSSGWLSAVPDFKEFGTNVAVSVRIYGGLLCYNNMAAAFEEMENHFVNGNYEVLRDSLLLCDTEHGIEADFAGDLLFGQMVGAIGSTIQILHSAALTNLCNDLSNATTPFEGLSNWVINRVNPVLGCLPIDYTQYLEFINGDQWDSPGVVFGTRQLLYQACTVYGGYRTSSGEDHPFGDRFPIDFFFRQCMDILNGTMTEEEIVAAIEHTNTVRGGLTPNVTNVYFTNGNLDPERTLSVQEDLNEDAVADNISYFGFAADWVPMNFTVYEGLRSVQNRVRTLITQWLSDEDGETTITTDTPTPSIIFD
ncbi:putative serine protease K12H4.7 [Phlebotomus argentipes]|uniref:putative serine protease K12H4.7 n=1 Tax=Phlebotomus argentipes TaxID=94469 RepID=UPI0028935617|nr:putative serine protease K12H4.7 [Phlebotomus argentipes]